MTEYLRGSLFDCLVDLEPHNTYTARSIKTLTREELKASIHRELTWLLNTTCAFSYEEMESMDRHTLSYGIQDFSCFFPDSSENRIRLGNMIREVIDAFEPRLDKVEVEVKEMNSQKDHFSLSLIIQAVLKTDTAKEPITFIMAID